MNYLKTSNGIVTVVGGEPIEMREGATVRLFDKDGKALFYWETVNGEPRQNSGTIKAITEGVIAISITEMMISVALDEAHTKDGTPLIIDISGEYSHNLTLADDAFIMVPNMGYLEPKDE